MTASPDAGQNQWMHRLLLVLAAVGPAAALPPPAPAPAPSALQEVSHDLSFLKNALYIVVLILALTILCGYRKMWLDPLYDKTIGQLKMPGARDIPYIGPCLGGLLGQKYTHTAFRLRLVVQTVSGLKGAGNALSRLIGTTDKDIYVRVKCGLNPEKTTSVVTSLDGSATWNEPVDVDVLASTDLINFEIME